MVEQRALTGSVRMARNGSYVAAFLVAVLCTFLRDVDALNTTLTYTLGFLAPSADSVIPASLANEWDSAFRVALEVMNSENRSYLLVESRQYTECDWQQGQHAAETLLRPLMVPPFIGGVGPACTDAAMSAGRVFVEKNYPLLSFAATSESLSSRSFYPTFFRTVFSDKHQAAAIAASVEKLNIKYLRVLTTQQYYSMNLGQNIIDAVGSKANTTLCPLHTGDNSTINSTELAGYLDTVGQDEFIIMAVQPNQAYDIWTAAYKMDRIRYPFWYFGTDGVTAFDPADTNVTDPILVNALQGEIGVAPHGGDILTNKPCEKFYSYWKAKNYPGFPSEGMTRTRSYVPHLIDAVQTYFLIIDNLIKANISVTKDAVLMALNGTGPGFESFVGCSGTVSFDNATGSRSISTQLPEYDLVSLTPKYWEMKGLIKNGSMLNLTSLTPPGSEFGPNSTYIGPNPNGLSSKAKVGIIVGTLLGAVAVLFLAGSALYLYRRKTTTHPVTRSDSTRRMMDFVGTGSFRRSDSFRVNG
ncbi:hypothetical protein KC19_1G073000 [Ceratodon purpureus]|uniref:Receptor ligand binding region domain-containing protein n=1 Tax=Ceratodon purpureus TaxID=3225 RepID=A0A8T0J2G4_CERPU|nr:hypothetical protein KC19_1G073000 [Ceratodon purpureus]